MSDLQQQTDTNVCSLLKKERKRLNLNQKVVADFLGMSTKQVSRWESSSPIPSDKLAELAKLGFDVTYIVTGERIVIDESALEDSIEIVEDALQMTGKTLNPVKKAKLICVIYEEYIERLGKIEPEQIIRHLRLVS